MELSSLLDGCNSVVKMCRLKLISTYQRRKVTPNITVHKVSEVVRVG